MGARDEDRREPVRRGDRRRARGLMAVRVAVRAVVAAVLVLGCQVVAGDFKIRKPNVVDAATSTCKAGDNRCNGEYLLVCGANDSGWVLKDTCGSSTLCDSKSKQCRVCQPGDFRCNGAARESCTDDGKGWKEVERCPSEAACNPTFCGSCTVGELGCRGTDGTELWQCGPDGTWSDPLDDCATSGLCSATLDAARSNPSWDKQCLGTMCTAGAYKCDRATLEHCKQDQSAWEAVDTCATTELCNSALTIAEQNPGVAGTCPEPCSAGTFLCKGNTLTRCRDDLTGFDVVMDCPATMDCNPVQGACTAPCTPGEFQCNGSTLRQCTPEQTWKTVSECASAALCQATNTPSPSGQCLPPACQPGEYDCEETELVRCRADLTDWEDVSACDTAELCDATDHRCNPPVCGVDELRCFGNELDRCNAGRTDWDVVQTCAATEFCNNDPANPGCLYSCPEPGERCNGLELQKCTTSGWVHQANCATNELCSCALQGTCQVKYPQPDGCGAPLCGGTLPSTQCVGQELQRCDTSRNSWATQDNCGDPSLCYPGAAPDFTMGTCLACPKAGEQRCMAGNPTTVQQCSNDRLKWNTTSTCGAAGCIDYNTSDYCAVCNTGDYHCNGAELQVCNSARNGWNHSANCATTALCDASGKRCITPTCSPNTYNCDGAQLQVCNSDRTAYVNVSGSLCVTSALCDSANGKCNTPACMPTDMKCNGAQPQKCNSGQTAYTDTGTACATSALCSGGMCSMPACDVDQKKCSGAQPQICNAGRTAYEDNGAACGSQALCSNGSCLACTPMQHQCVSGLLQVCNATQKGWDDVATCAPASLCNEALGRCDTCATGDKRCSGKDLETCNATHDGWDVLSTCTICDQTHEECDDCVAPAYDCRTNSLYSCDSTGHFVLAMDCGTDTCDASAGTCVTSGAGGTGGMGGMGGAGGTAGTSGLGGTSGAGGAGGMAGTSGSGVAGSG